MGLRGWLRRRRLKRAPELDHPTVWAGWPYFYALGMREESPWWAERARVWGELAQMTDPERFAEVTRRNSGVFECCIHTDVPDVPYAMPIEMPGWTLSGYTMDLKIPLLTLKH